MKRPQILKLIISIALPISLGAIAGMFTSQAVPEWYSTLNSPFFSPPNWIFSPVWTFLYIIMGISLFIIWREPVSIKRNKAIAVFIAQMALNFAWSFIFFYFKMIGIALIEIILLWITILIMLYHFYKVKPIAAYMNIPYILWVTFAAILNAGYYILN
ncbi:tryptophan-rich sensory protein [Marinilabiliaceae bacterium ANBcel2]|nr:tryptophan-rich sensory protein [Marinilabiliaceae bacterium ANBcel2]